MFWVMLTASIIAIFVAILLAWRGWLLLMWLTKRREAYDLYCSVIATLQQLEGEGIEAWQQGAGTLDRHAERKLTMKLKYFEKMLDLLWDHYYKNRDMRESIKDEILIFRMRLTKSDDSLSPTENRSTDIHRLVNNMMSKLLDTNYAYLNQRRWWLPDWL